jgi:hypothetical protein
MALQYLDTSKTLKDQEKLVVCQLVAIVRFFFVFFLQL